MDLGLHLHATGKTKNLYLFKKRFVSSHLPFHHKAFCKRKLTDGKFFFLRLLISLLERVLLEDHKGISEEHHDLRCYYEH